MTAWQARTTLALWAGAPALAALLVAVAVVTGHSIVVASGVLVFAVALSPIVNRLRAYEDEQDGRTATLWSAETISWFAGAAGWPARPWVRVVRGCIGLYLAAVAVFLVRLALVALL